MARPRPGPQRHLPKFDDLQGSYPSRPVFPSQVGPPSRIPVGFAASPVHGGAAMAQMNVQQGPAWRLAVSPGFARASQHALPLLFGARVLRLRTESLQQICVCSCMSMVSRKLCICQVLFTCNGAVSQMFHPCMIAAAVSSFRGPSCCILALITRIGHFTHMT